MDNNNKKEIINGKLEWPDYDVIDLTPIFHLPEQSCIDDVLAVFYNNINDIKENNEAQSEYFKNINNGQLPTEER